MRSKDEADQTIDSSDPAALLPFTKDLEPHTRGVERLPKEYIGMDRTLYTGDFGQ